MVKDIEQRSNGMKIFKANVAEEDKAVSLLVEEQRRMESIEMKRREWCISKAIYLEDVNQDNLIKVAEKIYEYVYGSED